MAPKLSHQIFGAFLLFLFLVLQPFVVESRRLLGAESLQNLVGAEKGDTFNGLYQVKQYLKAFGYYPNGINVSDHNDHFDDILESALKAYQENYHLKVTGKIDPDTIKEIVTPRCGVPDNGHLHHPRIFHLIANYSFFNGKPKWRKNDLTYTFRSAVQVVSLQVLKPIIARAFQKWADVSNFKFQEAKSGSRADISIGFFKYRHGDNAPFDGPGNVTAHAYAPPVGMFHYDASEGWTDDPTAEPTKMDLESIAVHEIGHLLGLEHSQDQDAVMYPSLNPGVIKRNLTEDDIDGIKDLYS